MRARSRGRAAAGAARAAAEASEEDCKGDAVRVRRAARLPRNVRRSRRGGWTMQGKVERARTIVANLILAGSLEQAAECVHVAQ